MKYSKELHDKLRHTYKGNSHTLALLDEIERLQAERRWIPVSERLPEYETDVLVWYGMTYDGRRLDWYGVSWRNECDDGKWCTDPVLPTHWMPLPPPPEELK